MNQFEEPMAGKGKTLLENDFLLFVDEQRKNGVCWHDIPLFRDWVEAEYTQSKTEKDRLKKENKELIDSYQELRTDLGLG